MKRLAVVVVLFATALIFSGCALRDFKVVSGLQVVTNDQPSSVFINGQYLNKTPFIDRNLKPGVYNLLIQPDDTKLVPYETTITLRKGLVSMLTWKPSSLPELSGGVQLEMEKLDDPKAAEVSITSIPDGAIIHVDERKEFSPVTLKDLSVGHHVFDISLPSYETQRHTLDVQAGYRLLVHIKLAKTQPAGSTGSMPPAVDAAVEQTASASASPTPALNQNQILGAQTATASATVSILPTNFFAEGEEVLRVRKDAAPTAAEIGFVSVGKKFQVTAEKGSWYQIQFNGQSGWISAQFARKE